MPNESKERVWIVASAQGEYDEYREDALLAMRDEQSAKQRVAELQRTFKALNERYSAKRDEMHAASSVEYIDYEKLGAWLTRIRECRQLRALGDDEYDPFRHDPSRRYQAFSLPLVTEAPDA